MESLAFMMVLALAVEIHGVDTSYKLCTREGIQCKDCSTVGNCIPDGSTKGYRYDDSSEVCPGNIVCDETKWYCARKGFCRFKKFECPPNNYEDEVIFPDPYSCTLYHGCQGKNQYDYLCYGGTAFNPVTRNCSLKLSNRICKDYPVPLCEKVGDSGTIPGTAYAYECIKDPGPPRTIYPKLSLKVA